jgi:hypothetical protein
MRSLYQVRINARILSEYFDAGIGGSPRRLEHPESVACGHGTGV